MSWNVPCGLELCLWSRARFLWVFLLELCGPIITPSFWRGCVIALVTGVGIIFSHFSSFRLQEMCNCSFEPVLFILQSLLRPWNSWLVSQSFSYSSRWCRLFRDGGSQKHSAPSFEGRQTSRVRKALPEGWPLCCVTVISQKQSTILFIQRLRESGSRICHGQP